MLRKVGKDLFSGMVATKSEVYKIGMTFEVI